MDGEEGYSLYQNVCRTYSRRHAPYKPFWSAIVASSALLGVNFADPSTFVCFHSSENVWHYSKNLCNRDFLTTETPAQDVGITGSILYRCHLGSWVGMSVVVTNLQRKARIDIALLQRQVSWQSRWDWWECERPYRQDLQSILDWFQPRILLLTRAKFRAFMLKGDVHPQRLQWRKISQVWIEHFPNQQWPHQ